MAHSLRGKAATQPLFDSLGSNSHGEEPGRGFRVNNCSTSPAFSANLIEKKLFLSSVPQCVPTTAGLFRQVVRKQSRRFSHPCRAMGKENSGAFFNGRGGDSDRGSVEEDPLFAEKGDGAKCPVPWDQQPINEYKSLSSSDFFSWVQKEPVELLLRLGVLGFGVFALLGWPVASLSFDPSEVKLGFPVPFKSGT